jgi:hypothetical protein
MYNDLMQTLPLLRRRAEVQMMPLPYGARSHISNVHGFGGIHSFR